MPAVIAMLGGIRAAIFAGLALVLMVASGVLYGLWKHEASAHQAYRDKMVAATASAAVAAADAAKKVAELKEAYYLASAAAESNYQAGRESAQHEQDTIVADLRADRVRLRREWAACMSKPAGAEAAPAASGGQDGAAPVPSEAFGRVLRVGSDADNQVRWLQAELIATRKLVESCSVK